VSEDLRLVGFEELSAGALRERLLARRAEFWSGSLLDDESVRALHDPLFFHQLGGFGAVALGPGDEDAGYLLGVVTADRLGVVHAVAVHPGWRRRGVAARLVERFATLATSVGARGPCRRSHRPRTSPSGPWPGGSAPIRRCRRRTPAPEPTGCCSRGPCRWAEPRRVQPAVSTANKGDGWVHLFG
jgi:GNAT superfamily N-acetyltransferase